MRRRIFTEAERGCLETWLGEDTEDPITMMTLSRIRKGWPSLAEDMELMLTLKMAYSEPRRSSIVRA